MSYTAKSSYLSQNHKFNKIDLLYIKLKINSRSTPYDYQGGYIFSDVDTAHLDVAKVLDWSEIDIHTFRTASDKNDKPRTVVLGSCRYLLRFGGGSWFDDRGDKTFHSIGKKIGDKRNMHALLMVGDQIYADDLSFVNPDDAIDEYYTRYRTVFSCDHIRSVMASLPTYMTLDDHEIQDNWPAQASSRDYFTKYPAAIHAYLTYQLSHSPLHPIKSGRIQSPPDRLWYTHRDGCCDFFFSDTRTERCFSRADREIISPTQLDALLCWLADGSDRVKVLVTAVPFWESTSDDKWHGFITQRDRILEHIRTNRIRRVLIVSGDVHASMSSELCDAGDSKFKIVSVVSSAFFWPYFHPWEWSFHLHGQLQSQSGRIYSVDNASDIYSTDNFTLLRIKPDGVRVKVFNRKGDLLGRKTHRFV